jgi:hypothetical protein
VGKSKVRYLRCKLDQDAHIAFRYDFFSFWSSLVYSTQASFVVVLFQFVYVRAIRQVQHYLAWPSNWHANVPLVCEMFVEHNVLTLLLCAAVAKRPLFHRMRIFIRSKQSVMRLTRIVASESRMQSWDVNRTPGRTSQKTQDHLSLVPLSETQTFAFSKLASRLFLMYTSRMKQRVSIIKQLQFRDTPLHADYESEWRGPQLAFNILAASIVQ